jgi:hypothetical protein
MKRFAGKSSILPVLIDYCKILLNILEYFLYKKEKWITLIPPEQFNRICELNIVTRKGF